MPNISLDEVRSIRTLLGISRGTAGRESAEPATTDIEDLHLLMANGDKLKEIEKSFPSTVKRVKRILAISTRASRVSPALEAARTKEIKVGTLRQ
jgi:hypothetical protein